MKKRSTKIISYILMGLFMLLVADCAIMGITAWLGLPSIIGIILVFVCAWYIGAWVGRRI